MHASLPCLSPLSPPSGVPDTWDNLHSFFINRVRDRLHMVLCFSPVGKKFTRWAQQVRAAGGRTVEVGGVGAERWTTLLPI